MLGPSFTRRRLVAAGAALGALQVLPRAFAQHDEFGDAALRGAGSTLVQPLMEAWVRQYRSDPHQVMRRAAPGGGLDNEISTDQLDYEAVGSLAGIQRIRAGFVDFAATEMPLGAEYLRRNGLMQFAWVIGGVAVVANAGRGAPLRLDGATLAGIYLGRITRWNDAAIVAQNPESALKDEPIKVLHRADGSGSTFTFARYLSRHDADWRQRLGSELVLKWTTGQGVRGGSDMIAALKATPGSIGYVNMAQARAAGLPCASLRNAAGRYVAADVAHIAAALSVPTSGADELERLPIDAAGPASYPLVATVFGLMRETSASSRQRRAADFVQWTLTRGNTLASQLGYVNLPDTMAKATLERLGRALIRSS